MKLYSLIFFRILGPLFPTGKSMAKHVSGMERQFCLAQGILSKINVQRIVMVYFVTHSNSVITYYLNLIIVNESPDVLKFKI